MESNIYVEQFSGEQTFHYFLISDLHFGHGGQDKARLRRDLNRAKERNARIFMAGDIFDAILPSDKKRFTNSGAKEKVDALLNVAVREVVEFLAPYVDFIDLIGMGNHETSPLKFGSVDLIDMLVEKLNVLRSEKTKKKYGEIVHGGYEGFITLKFRNPSAKITNEYKIFYNHGQGGTAEVSKGTIDLNRRQYIDANLIWQGHKHTKIALFLDPKIGVTNNGKIYEMEKKGVITGCYVKNFSQYDIKKSGYKLSFGAERMRTPTAKGGVFLQVTVDRNGAEGELTI